MAGTRNQNNLAAERDIFIDQDQNCNVVTYPSLEEYNRVADPESFAQRAELLKKKITQLNNRIHENNLLAQQAALFQQGKLIVNGFDKLSDDCYPISHDFLQVLNEYASINDEYQILKEDAISAQLVARNDALALEKKVLRSYDYHPTFQATLNENISAINHKYTLAANENKNHLEQLIHNYSGRMAQYGWMTAATGVGTLLTKGALLPFFFGTVLTAMVDGLVTAARVTYSIIKNSVIESNNKNEIQEATSNINNEIENNAYNRFQQRFFSVCKSKQELNLDKQEKTDDEANRVTTPMLGTNH